MDGRISPDIFQLALETQSIIRDGIVPPDVGIEALGIAARDRQPIAEALKRMDRHPQASSGSTNRLGELLVDAHIITTDQLNQALRISVESGLPLGGTLVTQGIIHASLLPTVLRAQEQIRDGVLPRDAAIEELKAAMKIWAKAEAAMKRTDYAVEQPLKPSSVMSTLRDTLEGVAPSESHAQPQHQTPAPMAMPVQPPAQHQPSSLHAQLQQQQQQYLSKSATASTAASTNTSNAASANSADANASTYAAAYAATYAAADAATYAAADAAAYAATDASTDSAANAATHAAADASAANATAANASADAAASADTNIWLQHSIRTCTVRRTRAR